MEKLEADRRNGKDDKQMSQSLMVHILPLLSGKAVDLVAAPAEAGEKEIFSSWALFILIMLLILALFTSYILQAKKIQAVHETVISIIAGTKTNGSCRSTSDLSKYRNGCRPHHTSLTRKCYTGQRQLQLSVLL